MWSGPRNISTALMRSFEARGDCAVSDEPLYAYYLKATGLEHPGAAEVMASQPTDWRVVIKQLTGPVPGSHEVWYQKHMAHHLLDDMDRGWMSRLRHCLLIRRPDAVLSSYLRARGTATLDDLGFARQVEILHYVKRELGQMPIVLDSRDVLMAPAEMLRRFCEALGVDYTPAMLRWPPGRRRSDGVWAKHWYARVEASTGFAPYREPIIDVPAAFQPVLDAAMPLYETLYEARIRP